MNPHDLTSFGQTPTERQAPIPGWLLGLGVVLSFWAGGYLFFYSGGFRGDIYDADQITWGPVNSGPVAPPDPKVIGKRLYTANCAQCHQGNGLGQVGVYPPLAASEWVTGSKTRLIAILHKGIAGVIHVKGNVYNNNMPAWGDGAPVPLKDEQIAAVLTYIRSDWGNTASPIQAEEVARKRKDFAAMSNPWTESGLLALPDDSATPPPPPLRPRQPPPLSFPKNSTRPPAFDSDTTLSNLPPYSGTTLSRISSKCVFLAHLETSLEKNFTEPFGDLLSYILYGQTYSFLSSTDHSAYMQPRRDGHATL